MRFVSFREGIPPGNEDVWVCHGQVRNCLPFWWIAWNCAIYSHLGNGTRMKWWTVFRVCVCFSTHPTLWPISWHWQTFDLMSCVDCSQAFCPIQQWPERPIPRCLEEEGRWKSLVVLHSELAVTLTITLNLFLHCTVSNVSVDKVPPKVQWHALVLSYSIL